MAAGKAGPGFGSTFTTHMLKQRYENGAWSKARIVPFEPYSLSPSTVVFHYGQEIFEGFKVFRQPDGSARLFRADRNLARLNKSATRLCMPHIDENQVLFCAGKVAAFDLETGKVLWTSKNVYHPGYTTAVVFALAWACN